MCAQSCGRDGWDDSPQAQSHRLGVYAYTNAGGDTNNGDGDDDGRVNVLGQRVL